MKKVIYFVTIVFLLSVAHSALANEQQNGIVVWNINNKGGGISNKKIDLITGVLASTVEQCSQKRVISEGAIQTIITGTEKRQRCGSEDTYCMAEIAGALGAPEAISGDLGRVGNVWILNLRRIDVKNVIVLKHSSRQINGNIGTVVKILPEAVAELFGLSKALQNDFKAAEKFIKEKLGERVTCRLIGPEWQNAKMKVLIHNNQLAKEGTITKGVKESIECINKDLGYGHIVGVKDGKVIAFWGVLEEDVWKIRR